ncbi:NupC/NupG family nucleoside CNT transporter [Candidatus Riflebacteria bacterium]
MERIISFIGIIVLLSLAYSISNNKKAINWRLVLTGICLQFCFAILIFNPYGEYLFDIFNDLIISLLGFTKEGALFVFNDLAVGPPKGPFNFTFQVMPTIIFFSSLMAILYYFGVMQKIVSVVAYVMARTMKTSGAESLSAASNIFVGQTEAPLVVRPYVNNMTNSELMAIMTGGMATVAGGVMALYVGMLQGKIPGIAGHLMAASIMAAPIGLVMAKIMVPETEESETSGKMDFEMEIHDKNAIDAAARGAGEGVQLAINVVAMLVAFLGLLAMFNAMLGWFGEHFNYQVRGLSNRHVQVIKVDTAFIDKIIKDYPGERGEEAKRDKKLIFEIKGITEYSGEKFLIDGTNFWKGGITLPRSLKDPIVKPHERGSFPPKAIHYSFVPYIIKDKETGKVVLSGSDLAMDATITFTLQMILGWIFAPLVFVLGVSWKDIFVIGNLLGEKLILTELVSYSHLADFLAKYPGQLDPRSAVMATYALCGFANLGSIGIQIGGIGALAPERRGDLAKLGLKAMTAGFLTGLMTATVAGIFCRANGTPINLLGMIWGWFF